MSNIGMGIAGGLVCGIIGSIIAILTQGKRAPKKWRDKIGVQSPSITSQKTGGVK